MWTLATVLAANLSAQPAADTSDPTKLSPPKAGPVKTLPLSEVTPGMKAIAWTAFEGSTPEQVPVEIIGIMRNVWGPGQSIIMAKLGGKAARTNVAGGMSGSPVYYDGKLMGAISLRFSTFSPDAIAGITPIDLMLEINEFDQTRPLGAAVPTQAAHRSSDAAGGVETAGGFGLAEEIWQSIGAEAPQTSSAVAIETPLTFSGVANGVLDVFSGYFRKSGIVPVQGAGVGGANPPRENLQGTLDPGEPVAAVLITGDTSATGLGTVTYNDGKRVLAFGHAMFNMGPVEMPMARAEVLTVLASQLQPAKIANSADIVGALRQDRKSGIMGVLGERASMIPVNVKVRTYGEKDQIVKEKDLHYNVFQNQKLTPPLMVLMLYNSMFGLNDFAEESTFRLSGKIDLDGERQISLQTMQTVSETPVPAPLALAGWVGDKFQRLFTNIGELPKFKAVDVTIELLPERRLAVLEQAWVERTDVRPGDLIEGKIFLRPYRGERIEKSFQVKIPNRAPKGPLRLLVSDSNRLNRGKMLAGARNRLMTLSETVSLLNQEYANNQVYISLMQAGTTAHFDDKTLPNVPPSVLNVMRESGQRRLVLENQAPLTETSIPFDSIVSGSYSIALQVQ